MKLEQLIHKSKKEDFPWSEPDLLRIHEQIMNKVAQTSIEKLSNTQKMKNYMGLHWRLWAQSSIVLSGLAALVVLSVDQQHLYLKSLSQMSNPQARNEEIIQSFKENPELVSENIMMTGQGSDFYLELAYNQGKRKFKEQSLSVPTHHRF